MTTIYITEIKTGAQWAISHPIASVAVFVAKHMRFGKGFSVRVFKNGKLIKL